MSSLLYQIPEAIRDMPVLDKVASIDEDKLSEAMKEVDDFLQEFPPQGDYIEHLPELPKARCRYFLEFEQKLESGVSMPDNQACRLAEIQIGVPPPASIDVGEEFDIWNQCLNQIKIKLEYLSRQSDNLDIMATHGQELYEQYMSYYKSLQSTIDSEMKLVGDAMQEVNWERSTILSRQS